MATKGVAGSGAHGLRSQIVTIVSVALVWGLLFVVLATGQGCNSQPAAPATEPALTWDDSIGPLLRRECVVCHGDSGNLSLETYEGMLKGGRRGSPIVPGDSKKSLIVYAVRGELSSMQRMPLNRPPLADADIARLVAWIDAGAPRSLTSGPAPAPVPTDTRAPAAPHTPAPAPTSTVAPAVTHTAAPATNTPVPAPTDTVAPAAATPTPAAAAAGDAARGAAFWQSSQCRSCHGAQAQGNNGPKLAGVGLTYAAFSATVRGGRGPMPAFSAGRVSDQTLQDVYAWLRSLP